jgi:asparagine synthase (glutamine-hydrolysing)
VPGDSIATLSRYELSTYLGCALDRMDRMSMASGLEGRVPFLDVPLVEWGVGLHSSLKVRGRENKRVVKQLAGGSLSPAITRGAKSGFGLPIGDWFRGPELAALQGLVGEHLRGEADHAEALWLIANVYLWYDVQHGTAWDGGDEQGGQRGRAIATAG